MSMTTLPGCSSVPDATTSDASDSQTSSPVAPCRSSYQVVSQVVSEPNNVTLPVSIDGELITALDPFSCELIDGTQIVPFAFNPSTVDPITGCEYELEYTNVNLPEPVPNPIALSCSQSTLVFKVTAWTSQPGCVSPIVNSDPKIDLQINNCGGDIPPPPSAAA